MVTLYLMNWATAHHMVGGGFSRLNRLFKEVTDGKWGMGNLLGSGMINGFRLLPLLKSPHHQLDHHLMYE